MAREERPVKKSNTDLTRGVTVHALILPAIVIVVIVYGLILFQANRIGTIRDQLFTTSDAYTETMATFAAANKYEVDLFTQAGLYVVADAPADADAFLEILKDDPIAAAREGTDKAMQNSYSEIDYAINDARTLCRHAVRLAAEANGSVPEDPLIRDFPLTDEERAMTAGELRAVATKLLLGPAADDAARTLSETLARAETDLLVQTEKDISALDARLSRNMRIQGVLTTFLCILLLVEFILFYALILLPLNAISIRVRTGREITARYGLREFRYFSMIYNRLLQRKAVLEDDLRQSARVDTLTGLPNRLAEKHYLSQLRRSEINLPTAVLSLDVNNLKPTNDTMGHVAGDILLQKAADCIRECFGNADASNCFRTGGDEFVAILQDVTEAEVREKIAKFERLQREANISVAVGYAYSDDVHPVDAAVLFQQADREMYRNKAQTKRNLATGQLAMPIAGVEELSADTEKTGNDSAE